MPWPLCSPLRVGEVWGGQEGLTEGEDLRGGVSRRTGSMVESTHEGQCPCPWHAAGPG